MHDVVVVDYEEEDVDSGEINKGPEPLDVNDSHFPFCCGIGVVGNFSGSTAKDVERLVKGIENALTDSGSHDPDDDDYEGHSDDSDDARPSDEMSEKTIVLATTNNKQTVADKALQMAGFRPIIKFRSKTTRSDVTLWARGKYTIIRSKE